ncbi:ClpX C4-type zinc finger protein [Streptosporangiaceae bacterium NEAU-GS5]|nr:ClpX C4-type zinc finger protein [Streptosporangiaceae bacterium NEAU-GS5]
MPETGKRIMAHCSFCGKPSTEVTKMIAGPGSFICNYCVDLCNDILTQEGVVPASIPNWETLGTADLLERLPRLATVAQQAETSVRAGVDKLRAQGVTWERIGIALKMTRQSAWERFSTPDN